MPAPAGEFALLREPKDQFLGRGRVPSAAGSAARMATIENGITSRGSNRVFRFRR